MSASTAHLVSRDSPPVPAESGIVFFDGVCGMCNRFVDLLLKLDRQGRLKFAPLQGETAERLLSERDVASLETVVFLKDGRAYRSSSAAVRIWWQLGGFWKCAAALLWIIPKPLRDAGYWLIAKFRYRLFGKHATCRVPTPDEQDRFLP